MSMYYAKSTPASNKSRNIKDTFFGSILKTKENLLDHSYIISRINKNISSKNT